MQGRRITANEARELTLEIWRYLHMHPTLSFKEQLPPYLFDQIKYMRCYCPLCEYFYNEKGLDDEGGYNPDVCIGCPLHKDKGFNHYMSIDQCQGYNTWARSNMYGEDPVVKREEGAKTIIDLIEASDFGKE